MEKLGKNQFAQITNLDIIKRFNDIHNNKYDYSKVEYKNMNTKVCIICPEHGEFWQTPHNHLKGQNCPLCTKKSRSERETYDNKLKFIKKSTEIFNNKFDYSKVEYINNRTKVKIICPIHGEFEATPYEHISSQFGCKKCATEFISKNKIEKNKKLFIEKASKIHNDKYQYNEEYNGIKNNISIICPIHGEFTQNIHDHLQGCGCPKCSIRLSNGENEIYEYLLSLGLHIIHNDRTILNGKELDIYIPEKKLAIEYNGLRWHSEQFKNNARNYHIEKTNKCIKQGIRLIHIFEDEWRNKQELVKSRLNALMGIKCNKIRAHKCKICNVNAKIAMKFLDDNHLQGRCKAKYYYGLYYKDKLVSLMTFGKIRQQKKYHENYNNEWELLRFCNKLNTTVYGGASKLLKHFINENNPKTIISYADKRWSDGNLYRKLGFTYKHDSKPNYFYIIGQHRENRFKYRKSELIKKYNCPPEMSEHEFCKSQEWYRIYDCGTIVFEMKV